MCKTSIIYTPGDVAAIEIINATNKPKKAKLTVLMKNGELITFKLKTFQDPDGFYRIKRSYIIFHDPINAYGHQTNFEVRKDENGKKIQPVFLGDKDFCTNIDRVIAEYEKAAFYIQTNFG